MICSKYILRNLFRLKKNLSKRKKLSPKLRSSRGVHLSLPWLLYMCPRLYLSGLISMHRILEFSLTAKACNCCPVWQWLRYQGLWSWSEGTRSFRNKWYEKLLSLKLIYRASSNERLSLCWSRAASKYKASSKRSCSELGSLAVPGSQQRHGSSQWYD